jgi:uncharacterized protein (DUF1684 family)
MKQAILLFLFFPLICIGQSQMEKAKKFQDELNEEYADKERSPLTEKDFKHFEGLPFFSIDTTFAVKATLEYTPNDSIFKMKTTTDRLPEYRRGAIARFIIDGKEYELSLYRNLRLMTMEKYKNYYFLPFKDNTCGNTSYGGGRFMDFNIVEGQEELIIDFNMSYNPLCAYNVRYSCPIVPQENYLDVEINAGVMAPAGH